MTKEPLKVYAVKLNSRWVELRLGRKAPVKEESSFETDCMRTRFDLVPFPVTRDPLFGGWQFASWKEKERHTLKQVNFVGGRVICPVKADRFYNRFRTAPFYPKTIWHIVELDPESAQLVRNRKWRQANLLS